VRHANRQHALSEIESRLRSGGRIFLKLIEQRNQQIASAATIVSRDHAFQEAFAGAEHDRLTTLSALESLQGRVHADLILIASLDDKLLFDTQRPQVHDVPFPFPKLVATAESAGAASTFVVIDQKLYAMAAAALLAPEPIAWLCSGFRVDDAFAREIETYTHLEITFVGAENVFATTFDGKQRSKLLALLRQRENLPVQQVVDLRIAGEDFLSYSVPLEAENGRVIALLQRSLDRELAPYLRLERTYLLLALVGLAISIAIGIWVARGVSQPVLELARGARKIAQGDYQYRVKLKQIDELGSLGHSFNQMSEGLAERDRVRDLLGKVISPEVATELLRRGVTLGGEEREVTVLFSDLRNFTGMCEALPPQEMLAILNHYFTRMAAIVEKHGGVVDKYVGDALMAIFGAPLANADDADRALRSAIEMLDALDELNRDWRARGLPTIGAGIGVNTDIVIAGNMGSETRLNYTVIGDGVNLASRLEGLTKIPEYEARLIVSAATLSKAKGRYRTRRLGEVAVKGKQNATEIFALLGLD
jgi:adenylate cyclase